MRYTVLSLFSGIGGLCCQGIKAAYLEERFRVTDCVEALPYRREVLKKHLPTTTIHHDIKSFTPRENGYHIVCGGSPCQDNSIANPKGEGLRGEQSALWWEMLRVIAQAKPGVVLWENPSGCAYCKQGEDISPLGLVVGSLATIGYVCQWQAIRLSALGAAHRRERILLIAYTPSEEAKGRGEIPPSWERWIGEDTKKLLSLWSCKPSPTSRVANGLPKKLHIPIAGWWEANPFMGIASMGAKLIKDRHERNSALGDSCSPMQSAIAWKHIYRILQWDKQN